MLETWRKLTSIKSEVTKTFLYSPSKPLPGDSRKTLIHSESFIFGSEYLKYISITMNFSEKGYSTIRFGFIKFEVRKKLLLVQNMIEAKKCWDPNDA